jgi:hypothetical protein
MHAAYFAAYQVTVPYDVVIVSQAIEPTRDAVVLSLAAPFLTAASYDLLVNMGRAKACYAVSVNGQRQGEWLSDAFGQVAARLPRPADRDTIRVEPVKAAGGPGPDSK